MNKANELIKNTAIITIGKLCTQLVSFFLLPLYTALLSKEEYGVVDLVITYSTLLLPVITLSMDQGLFRFLIDVRDDSEKTSQYISTVIYTSACLLLFTVLILFSIFFFTNNNVFLFFILVLISITVSNLLLQICRGLGDNMGYTIGSTVSAILQVVCNVLFLVVFKLSAQGMMLASFVGNTMCGVICAIRCRLHRFVSLRKWDHQAFQELSKYSLPLIPNQLSWWVLNAADKLIVQFFIGVASNGLIAVATKFSGVYVQFSSLFNISWSESASLHYNEEDAEQFFTSTINEFFKLFLSLCCGIIVCMPLVFPLMINPEFGEAYNLIPIFMFSSLFNVIASLYGVIYIAYKKTFEITKTAFYAAVLNIISHLLLVRSFGIYAAAISTAIGFFGMALFRYFNSRKYMTIKISNYTILISLLMLLISFVSYYSGSNILQILSFIIVLIISIIINRNTLLQIWLTFKYRFIIN